MYSLEQFASMFADKVRMDAYSAAIERSVRPGDVVVDLGCGPGIFAFLAVGFCSDMRFSVVQTP